MSLANSWESRMSSSSSSVRGDHRSASLNGRVEFYDGGFWFAVIDPAPLLPKHYDLFGLLFGVSNFAGFRPLFASRGLPVDCDEALLSIYDANKQEFFGETWVIYAELLEIDWNIGAEAPDERIHEFIVGADETERYVGKVLGQTLSESLCREIERCGSARSGATVYRRKTIVRGDAKEGTEFDILMTMMGALARRFGPEMVRLVVFFD
jgi:hypothetical protein